MTNLYKGRKVVKLLALAGFSMYLPSCGEEEEGTENLPRAKEPIQETLEKVLVKDTVAIKEPTNVTYFRKEDEQYNQLNQGFNLHAQKQSFIIALVENTQGVVEAIKFAKQEGLKVTVKSGGHSFESFSSNDGGLMINLSLLNTTEWLNEEEIEVGPALKLKELYDTILPKNRIIPTGSCGTVGVGGVALGGGYGFLGRKHGLTCDHLIEATMVDGQGNIHRTKEGEELMWALRGGGNGNFGIVTSMKFRTHQAPNHFTRHQFKVYKLDLERAKSLLKTWFEYSVSLPESCFSAFVLNGKTLTMLMTNFDETEQAMIDAFQEISDKASIGTPKKLAKSLINYYGIQHPIYFKNASAGYYNGFEDIAGCVDQVIQKVLNTRGLIYQVNTLGGEISSMNFQEKSSYPHRNYPFLFELQSYWEEGQSPKKMLTAFDEIQELIYNNGLTTQYRNYPNLKFKNWKNVYFGENYTKLQKINYIKHPKSIQLS